MRGSIYSVVILAFSRNFPQVTMCKIARRIFSGYFDLYTQCSPMQKIHSGGQAYTCPSLTWFLPRCVTPFSDPTPPDVISDPLPPSPDLYPHPPTPNPTSLLFPAPSPTLPCSVFDCLPSAGAIEAQTIIHRVCASSGTGRWRGGGVGVKVGRGVIPGNVFYV